MDKNLQPVPITYEQTSVTLPLNEDAFKEFMVSLLGQPESVEGCLEGAFEIGIGDFEYLNNLLDNRIATQNASSLLEFRAKLFFSDGSSISFNGIRSFIDYSELRPLICEGFVFTWSYLVKFNNKQTSEKQEISISSIEEAPSITKKARRSRLLLDTKYLDKAPKITYSVRCTNKEWGIEITEIIRKYLSTLIKVNLSFGIGLRRKIIENFSLVEISCVFLSFFLVLGGLYYSFDAGMKACRALSKQAGEYINNTISLDRKMNFIIQLVDACQTEKSASFVTFLLSMILAIVCINFIPLVIYRLIQLPNYRFLLFTKESKKVREEYFRKLTDRRTFWIVTVLIGLIIGILGNYIFTFLTSIWR